MITPLVSCIMPTFNRRQFVPDAIRHFLLQDYGFKELVIVDDGSDPIIDLVPCDKQIKYVRLLKKITLGEKRNICIRESNGDLIMHWDDDDWMAPYRISYQVNELMAHNAEICGLQEMYFYELITGKGWLYKYPSNSRPWLAGGSLLYTRNFWVKSPFPNVQVASDTRFIFSRDLKSYRVLPEIRFYVAVIHGNNTSPKKTGDSLWHPVRKDILDEIMGSDHLPSITNTKGNLCQNPELQVFPGKKNIAVLITTCKRPFSLHKLITKLNEEKDIYDISFFIFDDSKAGNGKKKFWKTINDLWQQIKAKQYDYYLHIQDDALPEDHFVARAIRMWENIEDKNKIVLNLFLDGSRLGKTCWTGQWPQLHSFKGTRYLLTQWVDMFSFICEKAFFEKLDWKIEPISDERWSLNPELSSGVGRQISNRLCQSGWNLYQLTESLSEHIGDVSIMNPKVRIREPMKSVNLPFIFAGMASIPERETHLKKSIESIIPCVDHLFIFLNDYHELPPWLTGNIKVTAFLSSQQHSNMGDSGKFFGLNKIEHEDFYYFTIDDDMIYPPDYTWTMIRKIEQYHRKCVVSCGGYIMEHSVDHFYKDRLQNWHISLPNSEDRPVHILHTGLAAWHSSTLSFRYEDCLKPNMADLWLAVTAQRKQIPMIVIERPVNWVKTQSTPIHKTIYGRYRNDCHEQTLVYNSWTDWRITPCCK
jgi:glycosyltransferase involved in cell wall biosynthesis